jgi:hypothetical protein
LSCHWFRVAGSWSSQSLPWKKNYNTIGYRHLGDGRIEIEDTLSGFIGFIIFLAVIFACSLLVGFA